ncbi:NUMOD4 domain-containing protein [Halobacillus mangrovi]|uniref:Uncharacterized protein n=1 Tax=Halobacillus mangrovi TaxID=402384 RepID=A0A1W5ZUB4_9BACI|nr:NUMOD4 domain-containing protein [Halobacillus mangrovi]ARI76878.1 hypothetical protein HM131_08505 [Halobacillus mangrovi]
MDTQTLNKINEITSVGEWKDVEGYPNYMVNTDGAVLSKTNGKILYLSVLITKNVDLRYFDHSHTLFNYMYSNSFLKL